MKLLNWNVAHALNGKLLIETQSLDQNTLWETSKFQTEFFFFPISGNEGNKQIWKFRLITPKIDSLDTWVTTLGVLHATEYEDLVTDLLKTDGSLRCKAWNLEIYIWSYWQSYTNTQVAGGGKGNMARLRQLSWRLQLFWPLWMIHRRIVVCGIKCGFRLPYYRVNSWSPSCNN